MSTQITDIARDLNIPAADIVAIVNQLSEIDTEDTVDANRPVPQGDVIECPDGTYANSYLTPAAIESLYEEFGGDRAALAARYGIL
jgi:hypothetical protein